MGTRRPLGRWLAPYRAVQLRVAMIVKTIDSRLRHNAIPKWELMSHIGMVGLVFSNKSTPFPSDNPANRILETTRYFILTSVDRYV